ncbi:MAG: hypothetical protein EA397_04730 [Deltaproteobacteria bacterium]|nr:MAG: hypothetical protein EA397_04730 [Deltaproteobacteria bacterium]
MILLWLLLGVAGATAEGDPSDESGDPTESTPPSEPPPPPPLGGPPLGPTGSVPASPKTPKEPDSDAAPADEDGDLEDSPEARGSPPSRSDEIIVYGERGIDPERIALEKRLMDKGYDRVVEKDGYVIFRHDEAWKGEFRLYDDGWVRYKRQPVQFRPNNNNILGWASCALVLPCVRAGGQSLSKRKWNGVRRRALEDADELGRTWSDRVADRSVDRTVDRLPDQLEALWDEGEPLTKGGEKLSTPEARKAALLDYWESRTDTVWGNRVRAVVELFLRAEVQNSPWPFTSQEIRAFNARRTCEAVLDLDRPLDDVMEDLDRTSLD